MYFLNGDSYEGEWKQNMMNGKGRMRIKIESNKFDEYEGQMEND